MSESYKNGDASDSGPLKAIIYCRVASLVFPEKGLAIESREERCRAYAASRGYSIEKVVHDVAVSGLSQNRAGTNEILQFLANETDPGKYVVVIDDIGRLARVAQTCISISRMQLRRRAQDWTAAILEMARIRAIRFLMQARRL
ncbi:recombinase family protein [Nitrobacter sp.]|uniref:recombinase family protein n=1 Tax=Nitrobacter sp. TaxID=29420 RepID=UPI00322097BA